jgi:hypothetical protein
MRKVLISGLLVVALVGFAGMSAARADTTLINQAYASAVGIWDGCGKCVDKCHSCGHKSPCAPKCDTCKPKCEPTCKPKCEPKCEPRCEPKCKPCCPKVPCEYPDACIGLAGEFDRNARSRQSA